MSDTSANTSDRPIVVGTDGSPPARHAVLVALREAQMRGTGLRAVCAYDYGPDRYAGYEWLTASDNAGLYVQLRDIAEQAVTDTVAELQKELGGTPVEVEVVVEPGRPSQVLLEASADACLLVVGTRGASSWGRLRLGSTSTEVVHHAHLPVLVVPGDDPDAP
ncbi:universal stress protein [Streptomyces sp. H39-S7]|uniref:universal stress protein n=2 Tax=Streptomyces TaxID=1883 RepID=UPI0022AEAE62|nr:universal stress protein [Streptomyces sp. H39-S7]MCZ4124827.1 universal stress protein [Streptomyces sp. H39-S7]